jgi:hypothetical protein
MDCCSDSATLYFYVLDIAGSTEYTGLLCDTMPSTEDSEVIETCSSSPRSYMKA